MRNTSLGSYLSLLIWKFKTENITLTTYWLFRGFRHVTRSAFVFVVVSITCCFAVSLSFTDEVLPKHLFDAKKKAFNAFGRALLLKSCACDVLMTLMESADHFVWHHYSDLTLNPVGQVKAGCPPAVCHPVHRVNIGGENGGHQPSF